MKTPSARLVIGSAGLSVCGLAACFAVLMFAPLPSANGAFAVDGLKEAATVELDRYGAPHIRAESREDAFAALGYVSARDRLFQMDLLRRKTAGRLAEIFGPDLLASDAWSRRMGFERLSERILARLPAAQVATLGAYAAGVNQAMRDARMWPIEFTLLRYRPQPWRPQDSLLVALNLADLSYTEDQERAASVMRAALPATVVDFLTPESDCFNEALAPRAPERCASEAIPVEAIAGIMREAGPRRTAGDFREMRTPRGSNGWVVSGRRTRDGRAILANDMHLPLEIPNIWAQADLSYGDHRVEGLYLPGLPMIISGSNGHVAWGMTSVEGDFADLVRLRPDPLSAKRYLDERGVSTAFVERREKIEIRGAAAVVLDVKDTVWGPLSRPLLGEDVATRWTMLDPDATNLDLIEMDRITTIAEALPLLRGAGTPPLNGLVADSAGAVAWTLMGKIPKRRGFDGLFSEYWNAAVTWDGYLSPDETPQRVNPITGYLVNANQRMLSRADFERKLGHDYSGGYRAFAIDRALSDAKDVSERDMAAIQLDTRAEPYRYYQRLALRALDGADDDAHAKVKRALLDWDGAANSGSVGLPLIAEFRAKLVAAILSPLLTRCRRLDPSFSYYWTNVDVPIERLIDSARDELIPPPYRDWPTFLRDMLEQSLAELASRHGPSAHRLRWGDVSKAEIAHPLSVASPLLAWLLDMPRAPMAGCVQCVRFYFSDKTKSSGANARLVVAPGHERDGLIQMAGGQSGQFGSPHYADREADWVAGLPQEFRQTAVAGRLELRPARRREQSRD